MASVGRNHGWRHIPRRHIGDGRAIRQRQQIQTVTMEFNKFTHDAMLTQHLRDGDTGQWYGDPLPKLTSWQNRRHQDKHRHGLTKASPLRFDTTHTPAPQYAQTI